MTKGLEDDKASVLTFDISLSASDVLLFPRCKYQKLFVEVVGLGVGSGLDIHCQTPKP